MSIKDLTITEQNVQGVLVVNQPDRLTGTAEANKKVFDAFPRLLMQRFNLLLEALAGTGGAGEIPVGPIEGVTAENVQQALSAIQQNLTAYIDKIKSAVGASEVGVSPIGGMTAQNVQRALEELRKAIDDSVSGIIPGGSITADMLADDVTEILNSKISNRTSDRVQIPNGANIEEFLVGKPFGYYYVSGEDLVEGMPTTDKTWWFVWYSPSSVRAIPIYTNDEWHAEFTNNHLHKWRKVLFGSPPDEEVLPLVSGYAGTATYMKTQEGIVFVRINNLYKTDGSNLPFDGQIATLPEDCRPTSEWTTGALVGDGAYIKAACFIIAYPNGIVKIAGLPPEATQFAKYLTSTFFLLAN